MPRWRNTLKENCIFVLQHRIKNLEPLLYENTLSNVIGSDVANNKLSIEKYIRNVMGMSKSVSPHTTEYWMIRGWPADIAYVKSKENKQINTKSVFSQNYWLEKINPLTGVFYTLTEADFERNSRRPIRKEYWIKKGYSENEAEDLATNTKHNNNKKGALAASAAVDIKKVTSKRCTEYYIAKGFSIEESESLRKISQTTFSKDVCIKKYGATQGLAIWSARQDKWQNTLSLKTDGEKARINRLKLSKGVTVSKAENELFNEINKVIPDSINQFTLHSGNKKQFIYDILANNKIIEYNGDFWHANPSIYAPDFINPRTKLVAKDKWALDNAKIKFAESLGYKVLVIWESEFKNNKEDIIKQCIHFLTQ